MKHLSITKAREEFTDLVNRARYAGEKFIIQKNGKDCAAIISIADLKLFEKTLAKIEDNLDIQDADKAIAESEKEGYIHIEKIKSDLGI